ncbi:hypothetical protein Q0Z83_027100 [Actinoplanes sichuanensis]|nr:hypothetical protein Q0Z83_027100 [Actinoplanes sichuanensis]
MIQAGIGIDGYALAWLPVGYTVFPSGRLHLPAADDAAAVTAAKAAWAGRPHGPDFERWAPSDTLEDVAWVAAAAITRDGDWIEFGFDDEGDPKWNDHATAFFVAIAPFVRAGVVVIEGEDGARWSYRYSGGQVAQEGVNGWDSSSEPFGDPVYGPPPA